MISLTFILNENSQLLFFFLQLILRSELKTIIIFFDNDVSVIQ